MIHNQRRTPSRRGRRGSLVLAALPPALIAASFVFLSLTSTVTDLRQQELRIQGKRALHRSQSAMAIAQAVVKSSAYDARGNVVVRDALATTAMTGYTAAGGKTVHAIYMGERAEVWCSEVADGLIQLDAVARVGNVTKQVRSLVLERDSFARYNLFLNARRLNLGNADSTGWMHSNQSVRFYYGGFTYPIVTAVSGFSYAYGASQSNTTVDASSNPYADSIPMPSLGNIQDRSQYSDGALTNLLGGSSMSNYRVHVELKGKNYEITAYHKTSSTVLRTGTIPLPTSGVLYFDGSLDGIKGTLDGRVTIAATGSALITGSIQYVDSDGDTAYSNGLPADASDPYVPNPDYDGNSALGIMAGGDVTYSTSVPTQLELNGYVFSRGKFGVPNSSFGLHATLRILGGQTVETGVTGAYADRYGNITSGFQSRNYTFDAALANNPPPRFLAIDEPRFSAFRIVGGAAVGSRETDSFKLLGTPIGSIEHAANTGKP